MKTPDEIKKGLECRNSMICYRTGCPYYTLEDEIENGRPVSCLTKSGRDALAYIQQLERERDAAVQAVCKGENCKECRTSNEGFEWRGLPKGE